MNRKVLGSLALSVCVLLAPSMAVGDEVDPPTAPVPTTSEPTPDVAEPTPTVEESTTEPVEPAPEGDEPPPETVDPPPETLPTVLFIGDSMTAARRYNDDPTSPLYGWWHRTASALKMTPKTSSVGSSGFQINGPSCATYPISSFHARLGDIARIDPDLVIVAGGRNDMWRCKDSRHRPVNTRSPLYAGISLYMKDLGAAVDAIGLDRSKVWVMTPWGTKDAKWRPQVVKYVSYLAQAEGFHFVPTAQLDKSSLVSDGIHQNAKGNRALSNQMLAAMR